MMKHMFKKLSLGAVLLCGCTPPIEQSELLMCVSLPRTVDRDETIKEINFLIADTDRMIREILSCDGGCPVSNNGDLQCVAE